MRSLNNVDHDQGDDRKRGDFGIKSQSRKALALSSSSPI
jgi:hypothetical protein